LRETEKRLQRSLTDRAERDIQDAKRQADEIARQQQEIADAVRKLPAGGAERQQQARAINEKKDQLEARLGELEGDLDRGAREASREERPASRKMAEAAGAIRDNRLRDAVRYSKALVSRGQPQQANAAEGDISKGIDEVRQRLDEAQAALGQGQQPDGDRRDQALERAQRLARGAESLQERTRERAQANGRDQQGRDGQQARNGQQGQNGQERGQQGQSGQGQNGQQGQGQQGQSGQEGQGGQQGTGQNGQGGGDGGRADGRGDFTGADRGGSWAGGDATWGGWWNGGPVNLTAEDIRQLRGEARQFSQDAQALRGLLRGENIDPRELDEIVRALRQLEDERTYKNVAELARLQSFVAESLKRFEFGLRRKVDADKNAIALTGSDEVPEEFRKLVEQYYRSLARSPR
jgi:hypothetical protein